MVIPPMTGKWVGDYSYQVKDGRQDGRLVNFLIDIREEDLSFSGISVLGIGVDYDTLELFDRPYEVKGRVQKNEICFTKVYPSFFSLDEEGNPLVVPTLSAQKMEFNGRISKWLEPDRIFFAGEWRMETLEFLSNGRSRRLELAGIWTMRRSLRAINVL